MVLEGFEFLIITLCFMGTMKLLLVFAFDIWLIKPGMTILLPFALKGFVCGFIFII